MKLDQLEASVFFSYVVVQPIILDLPKSHSAAHVEKRDNLHHLRVHTFELVVALTNLTTIHITVSLCYHTNKLLKLP
jgi:hypothetical protein